jgi:hypothetical protein
MNNSELFNLYEKLYFNEVEAREHIASRLQTPLALIVAMGGAICYLLQNCQKSEYNFFTTAFAWFMAVSVIGLLFGIYYFVRSFYNNQYKFLPTALTLDSRRRQLESFYFIYPNSNELVENCLRDDILKYYIDYSSFNTQTNEKRILYLYKTTQALIFSATFSVLSFCFFYFGGLDKTPEVNIVKPVEIKGTISSERSDLKQPIPQVAVVILTMKHPVNQGKPKVGKRKCLIHTKHPHRHLRRQHPQGAQ